MDDTTPLPLSGIRVLDLSRLLPGPWCSQLLADLGAEVIKVETPMAGDYARLAPPELGFGGVFDSVNRGKKSVAIDYRRPAGRRVLLRLVRTADVFLESSRPGQMERRGLGESAVRAANPRIIYCSLSGFGQTGPYRDRPGHDIDYLAVGGILALLGPLGGRPVAPGVQLADIAGGTSAALHIVAALCARERTGMGRALDVAVLDAVTAWLAVLGAGVTSAGRTTGPLGGAYPCYTVYPTADGRWMAVGALEPPFWAAFCRDIERPDLLDRQFDPTAIEEVGRVLTSRSADDWLRSFGPDACVARVNLPAEAAADPQVRWRSRVRCGNVDGSFAATSTPDATSTLDATSTPAPTGPAPVLGADTWEILSAVGLDEPTCRDLEAAGILAGRQTRERAARAERLGAMLARSATRASAPPVTAGAG
jgi:crotonobetainyl-CoA:carnitine CoA-transferase CaiB-like acyl-CoA transferase